MYVDGGTTTMTTTHIFDNTALTKGANIMPVAGLFYYKLPTPPGFWLPNSECVANREACPQGGAGNDCRATPCSTLSGTVDNEWTPTPCMAPVFVQSCVWQTAACTAGDAEGCLLGKKIYTVPFLPIDDEFPYPCAAGYLGSNESAFQTSSDCAGKCPAGSFCPDASTIEEVPCPEAHFCPAGSATPRPCAAGSYSSTLNLQAASECTAVDAGYYAPTGSKTQTACAAGTYTATGEQGVCSKCAAGKFQKDAGQISCDDCTPGYFCPEGTAIPLPCPAGTVGTSTGLQGVDECEDVPVGEWAPLGSSRGIDCFQGFFCPGKAADEVHGGALPRIVSQEKMSVEEEVEVIQQDISLDITCDLYDPAAVRTALASQYGVDAETIELTDPCPPSRRELTGTSASLQPPASASIPAIEPALAAKHSVDVDDITSIKAELLTDSSGAHRHLSTSLTITITIKTSGATTSSSTALPSILSNVQAVSASSLGAAIGTALGTSVTVTSTTASTAIVTVEREELCPAGSYCSAGVTYPCPLATYNPIAGGECIECPVGTITKGTGSASTSDCGCKASFYGDANGTCVDCPGPGIATSCTDVAITLATLPLRPEYWRAIATSAMVRQCKTPGYCVGGTSCHNATADPNATVWLCDGYCARGHTGPFCELCLDGFVKAGKEGCIQCSGDLSPSVIATASVVAVIVAAAIGFYCCNHRLQRSIARAHAAKAIMEGVQAQVRILISLMQVLSKVGVAFATRFPPMFDQLISYLNLFALDFLDLVPLGCVFEYSFHSLLLARTLTPLAICALALLYGRKRGKKAMTSAVSFVFDLLFLVYPSTSIAIFSTFQFEQLDDAHQTKVLRADFNIDYDSQQHEVMRIYAGVMMVVYPLGLPLLFACLFYKHRKEMAELSAVSAAHDHVAELAKLSSKNVLASATSAAGDAEVGTLKAQEKAVLDKLPRYMVKLVGDYKGRYYYFEIIECMRKLLLVCIPVFFDPQGSVSQLMFGLMICFLTFGVYGIMRPYKAANSLAIVAQVTIFCCLLSCTCTTYPRDHLLLTALLYPVYPGDHLLLPALRGGAQVRPADAR